MSTTLMLLQEIQTVGVVEGVCMLHRGYANSNKIDCSYMQFAQLGLIMKRINRNAARDNPDFAAQYSSRVTRQDLPQKCSTTIGSFLKHTLIENASSPIT
jgi:uridylate kinase